jgi:hypothetical protein
LALNSLFAALCGWHVYAVVLLVHPKALVEPVVDKAVLQGEVTTLSAGILAGPEYVEDEFPYFDILHRLSAEFWEAIGDKRIVAIFFPNYRFNLASERSVPNILDPWPEVRFIFRKRCHVSGSESNDCRRIAGICKRDRVFEETIYDKFFVKLYATSGEPWAAVVLSIFDLDFKRISLDDHRLGLLGHMLVLFDQDDGLLSHVKVLVNHRHPLQAGGYGGNEGEKRDYFLRGVTPAIFENYNADDCNEQQRNEYPNAVAAARVVRMLLTFFVGLYLLRNGHWRVSVKNTVVAVCWAVAMLDAVCILAGR